MFNRISSWFRNETMNSISEADPKNSFFPKQCSHTSHSLEIPPGEVGLYFINWRMPVVAIVHAVNSRSCDFIL
jgi:hypothetical protein